MALRIASEEYGGSNGSNGLGRRNVHVQKGEIKFVQVRNNNVASTTSLFSFLTHAEGCAVCGGGCRHVACPLKEKVKK